MSLNSTFLVGPKLQRDFSFSADIDIRQMYRQILVLLEFRPFQHPLGRSSVNEELREY